MSIDPEGWNTPRSRVVSSRPKGQLSILKDGSRDWRRAVVLWLVRDIDVQTDQNAFLASYFFTRCHPEWSSLLGDEGATKLWQRIKELHSWQHDSCAEQIDGSELCFVPSDFGREGTTFAIQMCAQSLYYLQSFGCLVSKQQLFCLELLQTQLVPHLQEFIRESLYDSSANNSWASQNSRIGVALAVVNTVTLFMRGLGLLPATELHGVLALLRQMYTVEDCGQLDIYGKVSILAHIGLNCQGQCAFEHVAWIFEYFDAVQQELLDGFEDWNNPNRDIILDLVAEIVTSYRYFRHHTSSRALYEAFVKQEVHRKYHGHFVYRFYAHPDFPSDHEALSLYHMFIAGEG